MAEKKHLELLTADMVDNIGTAEQCPKMWKNKPTPYVGYCPAGQTSSTGETTSESFGYTYVPYTGYMRFVNTSTEDMTVTMTKYGSPTGPIQYSLDGKEWNTFNNFGTPYEVEYKQYADGRTELYDPNLVYDDEDVFDVIKVQVQEANIDPIPKGGEIYFKGDYKGTGSSAYINLTANKSHSVEGNIMSLTYGDDFDDKTTIESAYQYY